MTSPDQQILTRIGQLVDEERRLRDRHEQSPLDGTERQRMEQIEVELDQCWDLLNQRRALREFDLDVAQAHARDKTTVEGYLQ